MKALPKNLFKTEDSKFVLYTGLKLVGILGFVSLLVAYELFQYIRINFIYLKSNSFEQLQELKQAYFSFILSDLTNNLVVIFGFFILVFFMGIYLAKVLLRPFKNLGSYCQEVIDHPDTVYHVDQFSDYRLLTRFSENFFSYVREARIERKLKPMHISPEYMGIHKPVLDKVFLFHFGFFLAIILLISSWMIVFNATSIYEKTIQMALKYGSIKSGGFSGFTAEQGFVVDELIIYVLLLMVVFYVLLAIHLYQQVAGAAFGVFSTMRSFIKGNYNARVHLVGYAYVRDYTRMLNKYLDYLQKNLTSEHTKH